jgi:hypothetical protein
MKLPLNSEMRTKVQGYLRSQKGDLGFSILLNWFEAELRACDAENRNIGFENKSSEAKGLADFLEIVTACQASGADRNSEDSESDAESESAGHLM